MRSWYSNRKASWILVRGVIVLILGVVVGAWLNVDSITWVVIGGVPIFLTAINLGSLERTQVESSKQTREPLQ